MEGHKCTKLYKNERMILLFIILHGFVCRENEHDKEEFILLERSSKHVTVLHLHCSSIHYCAKVMQTVLNKFCSLF